VAELATRRKWSDLDVGDRRDEKAVRAAVKQPRMCATLIPELVDQYLERVVFRRVGEHVIRLKNVIKRELVGHEVLDR
jgi:hypothetical protein